MNLTVKLPVKSVACGAIRWFVRTYDDALPVAVGDYFETLPNHNDREEPPCVVKRTYVPDSRGFIVELSAVTATPHEIAELREDGWEDVA